MRTQDIEGANPRCVKFQTTRIGGNPLNPTYNLQSVTYLEPEPTKFIRDQLHIDDIEGSRPAKRKHLDIKTRDLMNIKDIEGASPKLGHEVKERSEGYGKPYNYNPMDYRDVTNVDFKSTRVNNPLMPTYTIRDEDGKTCEIGHVAGSNPNILPPPREDKNF
jgi:hypothetical protein